MKTAVSIPDEVFKQAERVAKRLKKSRSEFYADALAEYLSRREPSEVTSAIDAVLSEGADETAREFVAEASKAAVRSSEW